ncbi:CBS domain-containing protein [Alteribacillus bidgolensis]|uniref:tRNA nucleotidyltransferase (CCA-adding enzyme) n=1 Tax=Alteribacillus bidgolensis TaxID=930129 RepID=A0A1G8J525_9BACI|nr:CBS domain-containing protein [Alteribacillus bidgolensis]SDI26336.1 tRNA nucleotidyltransferase (CCA-adding enzyme) [Alteribacillus bidgolensis]
MEIILTHDQVDFDALASMVAASKLYPQAAMVLPKQQSEQVRHYLALYRDNFNFSAENDIDWEKVSHVILTDVAHLSRTEARSTLPSGIPITVYDHHPLLEEDKQEHVTYVVEKTGAAVTILIEEIIKQQMEISSYEATLFALGLYTDTGSFVYPDTTVRDLKAAVFLKEKGMQLDLVQQFSEETLTSIEQETFQAYLSSAENVEAEGLHMVIASLTADRFIGNLNVITSRVLETTGADTVITVTSMKNKIFIIGRSSSDRMNLLPVIKHFHGGGHEKAASASVKERSISSVIKEIKELLSSSISSAVRADFLMSAPVKTVLQNTTINEAKNQMLYYGHNGFPVVDENGKLIGIISRRDVDKANQHNLGHAPVKGYMSTSPVTITKHTSFEQIQQLMIQYNIGRLPVIENEKIIGIVSRTDVIEYMHNRSSKDNQAPANIKEQIETLLPKDAIVLLKKAGSLAETKNMKAYIIGGIVRDLILGSPSEDIDIVIEGDGISFAEAFANDINGTVTPHETFGTATVETENGSKLDFTTSRTEYYEKPAALPTVVRSNIKEDLFRRDFTMNAMAASLEPDSFGELIDYFNGLEDIKKKNLRVLHNLSFVEDPTRILRGIRFEARFSFRMDEETEAFLRHSAASIFALSHTRVITELKHIFQETNPAESLSRLHELGVLNKFLPGSIWSTKTSAVLSLLLKEWEQQETRPSIKEEWFFITACLYTENAETAKLLEAIAATKPQKKTARDFAVLMNDVTDDVFASEGALHEFAFHLDEDALFLVFLALLCSGEQSKARIVHAYRTKRKKLPRWVSGDDLKAAGLTPGPAFKDYLFQLEKAFLNGEITNRKEALAYIKSRM